MHLVVAFGPSYLLPGTVLLRSLRKHCTTPHTLTLLHRQADDRAFEPLRREFDIRPLRVREDLHQLPQLASHGPDAYLPLWAADSLPDCDRILFLDADVLCCQNLAELWECDLEGKVLGAVPDMAIPQVNSPRGVIRWKELGLKGSYFNAGVMLIDLQRWREEQVTARALDYLRQNPVHFLHQEALNVVLRESWKPLDLRWNLVASMCSRRYSPIDLPGYAAALENPGLIHYAGRFKPWRMSTHGRFGRFYRNYLTPRPESWSDRLLGFYDRYLRDWLYPLEQLYWSRR
jgi:lipopolysaccharide biosynthesis glycosyltransferase